MTNVLSPGPRNWSTESTPALVRAISTEAEVTALPRQVMSGPVNCAFDFGPLKSGSKSRAEFTAPMAVPSRGATLARWLPSVMLEAPGILEGRMFGLPGMCFVMKRLMVRAYRS